MYDSIVVVVQHITRPGSVKKKLKNLETYFFETIFYSKPGRIIKTNRTGRLRLKTNRMVKELCIIDE